MIAAVRRWWQRVTAPTVCAWCHRRIGCWPVPWGRETPRGLALFCDGACLLAWETAPEEDG